jgi:Ca2+:H+ antiporter
MYLLFQLKSHAYMYESTPQHIIDEESAPGPVAQWMESSDNDSSTSLESDSSSSSASNTTAKRLRRVIVRRRRRKSSSGSKDTADFATTRTPSITACSISPAHTDGAVEDTHAVGPLHPSAVDFAEDGDDEDREKGHGRSRKNSFIGVLSKRERKKNRKRREKTEGKRSKRTEASTTNKLADSSSSTEKQPEEDPAAPRRVDFAITEDAGIVTDSSQKRTFTLRGISSTIRPSVFMHPPPEPLPVPTGRPLPRVKYGIRRTNSLPDRLNQTSFAPRVPTTTNLQPLRIASTAIAEQKPPKSEDEENISRTTAVFLLLISTGLVAVCAEFMVDSINAVVSGNSGLSETFIGLIILPVVGNAAEHVTAVTVASKNKMDLAIGVAVGSSIQIGTCSRSTHLQRLLMYPALFVTPFIVLLGWCMSKDMSLYFTLFETVTLFVSAFIVNFLVLDGRSNYLEGSLLCAAYVIIAVAAFFYPQVSDESVLGGNPDATSRIMMVRGLVDSVMGM